VKPVLAAITLVLCASACSSALAADIDPRLERAVRESLPVCAGGEITFGDLPVKLPARFSGKVVQVQSADHACDGQYAAIVSPAGNLLLGAPWLLDGEEGKTPMEKLKSFTWRNMQENVEVVVDPKRTVDGLFPTTMIQTTANGKMPMQGFLDESGRIFFYGSFRPMNGSMSAARAKAYEPFIAGSPAKGGSNPAVTIVEFSDFQCPSCQRASGYVDPILAKYGDKVRYVRYDLPLNMHPWAFPAALAGRAIYRQKPEVFWEYKHAVYENQAGMNAMMFWDWARAFAEDHDLDLAKYDADLNDQALRDQILKGAGFALINDVRGTPSYMVNGTLVTAGEAGKSLAAYVDSLLAK
jgi:protein-disulfide isomerase